MKKEVGFTLSEVLITLMIIGVVTVILFSTIQQATFKTEQKNQFKKIYATLSNAITQAKADLGYDQLCTYPSSFDDCAISQAQMRKNLSFSKYCATNALANGCITAIKGLDTVKQANNPALTDADVFASTTGQPALRESSIQNTNAVYILQDGMIFMPYSSTTPIYLVDLNGQKKPNKWGYDIFTLWVYYNRLGCVYDATEPGGTTCTNLLKTLN